MEFNFADIDDNKLRGAAIARYVHHINGYQGRASAEDLDRIRVHIVKFFLRVEKVMNKWAI